MVPNELDNDAKEIMKRSPNFPNQAKDMAISLAPSHATVSMFAEIIHRLLEIKPTVRLERVASVELELPTLGFRLVFIMVEEAY